MRLYDIPSEDAAAAAAVAVEAVVIVVVVLSKWMSRRICLNGMSEQNEMRWDGNGWKFHIYFPFIHSLLSSLPFVLLRISN